jgi:hypothetical protein
MPFRAPQPWVVACLGFFVIQSCSTSLAEIPATGGIPTTGATTLPASNPAELMPEEKFAFKLNTAIERAVYFLTQRQDKTGAWIGENISEHAVGRTALVGLALLSAGESPQSPLISRALEFLKRQKQSRTYSVALRAAFYSQLPEAMRRDQLRSDTRWLIAAIGRRGAGTGMYTYSAFRAQDQWHGDYSNSQYGVLGVWYAEQSGIEVPQSYWKIVETAWLRGQNEDGGWPYIPGSGGSYASMSSAGAATLYIVNDYLHAPREKDLLKPVKNPALDRAVAWLGKYFAVDRNLGRDTPLEQAPREEDDLLGALFARGGTGSWIHYMLFGYERCGEASGLTRFGSRKWFDEGARFLINTQEDDGHWSGSTDADADTAYALLFLARGRAPVAMQKLQWSGRWNNRSRDAATLVRWLSRQTERHTNWQIVSADASLAEFREAPILYVAGNEPIVLSNQQRQRIRSYLDQGGLLLAVNEGERSIFAQSIEALARQWYPDYEMRDLPRDHLIFNENFTVDPAQPIRGLSNGVRELIVLVPSGDLSWKWQAGAGTDIAEKSPAFALAANLWLYITDKSNPRFKGEDYWVDAGTHPIARRLDVARLKFAGNWDPEPAGWTRLANVLLNENGILLKTFTVEPGVHNLTAAEYPVAHLTSTTPLEFTAQQSEALKKYLDGGGFLIFDAAGGSVAANISVETMFSRLYPGAEVSRLTDAHEIFTAAFGGKPISEVAYRRFALTREPASNRPRLKGVVVNKRLIAILSSDDLSAGLVGYPTDGIVGYTPQTATDLMRNILLWRLGKLRQAVP